ncbi:MAG: threonine synthase, partial [Clostridiales bacterium]|nr:threonine synthase [Clostridiales bacterium]
KYLTDYSGEELLEYSRKAYSENKFTANGTAPVRMLDSSIGVLELWHGPTCAFKDFALQILPYLLTSALKKLGETRKVCILVATSGDTGKAALEGFADVEGTKIAVFFPKDGVSRIQELQMTTQAGGNVYVSSVYGNFDNVQTAIKEIFSDDNMRKSAGENGYFFSSANSINWGRAVPQIVYYVSAYCDLINNGTIKAGEGFNVCVPTGNFGNILAAYYAREMGVPISKLICASNSNNVLTEFFNTGRYDANRQFYNTISPAMDILVSSNLERLIFHLSGNDDRNVTRYMSKLKFDGAYTVSNQIKERISELFYADYSTDAEAMKTISDIYNGYSYLIDTHTAVGVNAYKKYREAAGDNKPVVIASTASPFKFAESVLAALGIDVGYKGIELLEILSKTTDSPIPQPLAGLGNIPERFKDAYNRDDLPDVIMRFLRQ